MNRIDLVLGIVLAFFALRGLWRGFSREFFGFIGLIGGLAVAAAGYTAAVPYVPEIVPTAARPIVSFIGLFFAADLAAKLVGAIVHRLLGLAFLSPINRVAGGVFGVIKGTALATIALMLLKAYVPGEAFTRELAASTFARPLLLFATELGADGAAKHSQEPSQEPPQQPPQEATEDPAETT